MLCFTAVTIYQHFTVPSLHQSYLLIHYDFNSNLEPLYYPKQNSFHFYFFLNQVAYELGPNRPKNLQQIESFMWSKLIEVAEGNITAQQMLSDSLDEIRRVGISDEMNNFFMPNNEFPSCSRTFFLFLKLHALRDFIISVGN